MNMNQDLIHKNVIFINTCFDEETYKNLQTRMRNIAELLLKFIEISSCLALKFDFLTNFV